MPRLPVILNCRGSRAPRGARGLKYRPRYVYTLQVVSCPSRGTWIEIISVIFVVSMSNGRAPRGARGLKFLFGESLIYASIVVPLAGHVD